MPLIPLGTFERLLNGLTTAEFEAFVEDLWTTRGWTVERGTPGTFVIERDGEQRRLAVVDERGWLFKGFESAEEVDILVVRLTSTRLLARVRAASATIYEARDLYLMVMYAVSPDARERLFRRHFARDPTVDRRAGGPRSDTATRTRRGVGLGAVIAVVVAAVVVAAVIGAAGVGDLRPESSTELTATGTPTTEPPTEGLPTGGGTSVRSAPTPEVSAILGRVGWTGGWPTAAADKARTGRATSAVPKSNVTTLMVYDVSRPVTTEPVVVNGTIFFGTDDGNLYGLNASRGSGWRVEVGERSVSTPTVVDGTIYVGSDASESGAGDSDGEHAAGGLAAFDADTGGQRWVGDVGSVGSSAPAVTGSLVFVGSMDRHVYALDSETGEVRWRVPTRGPVTASPSVSNGTVFVGSTDGTVYAFDAETGTERWRFTTGDGVEASAAVSNGTVFVGSTDGWLYAIDAATGTERWKFHCEKAIVESPAVANGTVYVGTVEGRVLFAIDTETGRDDWIFGVNEPLVTAPVVSDDVVIVGTAEGAVYALNTNGIVRRHWKHEVGGSVRGGMAVSDGVLFVGTAAGDVYALGERPRTGSTGQ